MNAFERLMATVNGSPDQQGRYHYDCPFCGAEGWKGHTPQFHAHTYTTADGTVRARCYICNYHRSLKVFGDDVARLHSGLDLGDLTAFTVTEKIDDRPDPPWKNDATLLPRWDAAIRANLDEIHALWNRYKPISKETIIAERLFVTRFHYWNATAKRYELSPTKRLTVPLIRDGVFIGLRGRAFENGQKDWQTATKSDLHLLGLDRVTKGSKVIWCENVIDRLLLQQAYPNLVGIASGGLVVRDEWIEALAAARPYQVRVTFDHDLSGNGTYHHYDAFVAAWRQSVLERRAQRGIVAPMPAPPQSAGIALANRLLKAKVKAALFQWPYASPNHDDLGSLLLRQEPIYGAPSRTQPAAD
jgi:hypothetical protein